MKVYPNSGLIALSLVVRAKMRGRRKPNFLVIVVPDVNSPRLESQLQAGQLPYDRPDLLHRELHVRTGEMICAADCVTRVLFDCSVSQCMTIWEGQKRGCPHSCSLLWVQELKTSKTLLYHHCILNSKLLMSDRSNQVGGLFGGQIMKYILRYVSKGKELTGRDSKTDEYHTRGAAHSHSLIWIS